MIRIDELYYNTFVRALQHRNDVMLHWFDPFGSVDLDDLVSMPQCHNPKLHIIFWDQEPVYRETFSIFINKFTRKFGSQGVHVVTSERNSDRIKQNIAKRNFDHSYFFFHGWAALDWYRGYNRTFLTQPWAQRQLTHAFASANNIVRDHRIQFLHTIAQQNLIDHGIISFPHQCPYSRESVAATIEKLGLTPIPETIKRLPLTIDTDQNTASRSHAIDFWQPVDQAFCHVVTETLYKGNGQHLTEKTFKPIVMQQPFMLVAPAGSLEYLRSYGFKTFDNLWNESYDHMSDQDRIGAVAEQLAWVASWSDRERTRRQQMVAGRVAHNYHWFYNGKFENLLWHELQQVIKQWL